MAVRLHYRAARAHALSPDEATAARALLDTHNAAFPFDAELLSLDGAGEGAGETALHGSTTLPEQDPFTTFLGLAHWCQALTDLRRALPGTTWDVSVDDEPVPWDDATGFGWPEQRDPATLQLMEQMRTGA